MSAQNENSEIKDRYREEKTSIEQICRAHYLVTEFVGGELYAISRMSAWKIVATDSGRFLLFHQNGYNKSHKSGERMPLSQMEFHRQKKVALSLAEAFRYIGEHDDWRGEMFAAEAQARTKVNTSGMSKSAKRKQGQSKTKQRRKQMRNVLSLLDQVAICSGDYSHSYVVNC